jgi:hypothetical protein
MSGMSQMAELAKLVEALLLEIAAAPNLLSGYLRSTTKRQDDHVIFDIEQRWQEDPV